MDEVSLDAFTLDFNEKTGELEWVKIDLED